MFEGWEAEHSRRKGKYEMRIRRDNGCRTLGENASLAFFESSLLLALHCRICKILICADVLACRLSSRVH